MNDKRVSAESAVYLELANAVKDSDCLVIEVSGGISRDRGCCNLWSASSEDADSFSCGTCEYISDRADKPDETKPISQREANKMSLRQILDSVRPGEKAQ